MLPRVFEGQTVAIVAGGPSLKGFDFSRLEARPSIAINRAMESMPGATMLWWTDVLFWRRIEWIDAEGRPRPRTRDLIMAHRAPLKATAHLGYDPAEVPEPIVQYRLTGSQGFDPDPRCIRHGNNSAYAAMHVAVHLGARRLVLFGVDMRLGPEGESHFHSGHGMPYREETFTNLMLPFFDHLVEPLAERGVSVLNASPHSALTAWPRCTIDEGVDLVQEAPAWPGLGQGWPGYIEPITSHLCGP